MRLLIYTHAKTGSTALAYSALARLPDHRLIFEPPSLDAIPDEQNLIVKYISPNWADDHRHLPSYDSVIVLVRHPFDVLISGIMYLVFTVRDFMDDHTMGQFYRLLQRVEAKDRDVSMRVVWEWLRQLRPDWPVTQAVLGQFERLRVSLVSMKGHLLTKYEDACGAGAPPVDDALWFPISTDTTIASVFEHVERSKGSGGWRDWFSDDDCRYFTHIDEIRRYATACGYNLSEPVSAVQVRDRRIGSDYVRRLVNIQRTRFGVPPFDPSNDNSARLSPKLFEALTLRLEARDPKKAFDAALCACLEQPHHPAALLEFGIGALLNQFPAAAQCALSQAVSLCPENATAWNYLAESYRATGQIEEALEACREAIRIEPDSADHNQFLGSLLNRLGRWEQAEKHLRLAVNSPSGVEKFKWALIRNLCEQGKYQEALNILQNAEKALGHSAEYARLRTTIRFELERSNGTNDVVNSVRAIGGDDTVLAVQRTDGQASERITEALNGA